MKKFKYAALITGIAVLVSFGIVFYAKWQTDRERAVDMLTCGGNLGGGTITAVEGDAITARDGTSQRVVRITVGSSTNYYEPDLVTLTSSSAVIAVGNTVAVDGQSCSGDPPTLDARLGYIQLLPTLPDISAPAGWYAHRQNYASIIFTKTVDLPSSTATEGYAYGEQIDVSAEQLTPGWAGMNIGTASGTIGEPPANEWGTLDGYRTIKTVMATEADDQEAFAIFDPTRYTVYEFTLYPYPNPADEPVFEDMINDFAKGL
jgi:hypothetical protein